ncbi:MAG TPA: class I SAM-dependent methyltransferase [Acidothermaceae bacterium]|nr:class I SAM-dependent methyltransferase [Acidothermaceae bacterium]
MNAVGPRVVTVSPDWLALREPADAAARATDLVAQVRQLLPARRPVVVHDLGCGTGSMARWLAPQLPGPQHWVMYDRDADLLERAAVDAPLLTADGSRITVETRQRDITRLGERDLTGASLITASALLDMLTGPEVERIARSCVEAGCPVLLTISVIGRVTLTPSAPLDEAIASAFNEHQRRAAVNGRLLGPDAVGFAADVFVSMGAEVVIAPSPWRLGAGDVALTTEWFRGWVSAACEQRPELTAATRAYVEQRLADAAAGRLGVTVHHQDLIAMPGAR